ncbi:MAG: hypothetical protein INR68_15700 [Methylobacterium mesophilicum]|nr:hypothetical protein [Methylobacterium mesophilicum]
MVRRFLCICALSAAGALPVQAQSMAPMRGTVTSFSDEFALKVTPRNIYKHTIDMEVRVYDQDFRPVRAMVMPSQFSLGAGSVRNVVVMVPFEGQKERRVRVCAESVPFPGQQAQIRTQICGRFLASRLQ